MIYQDGQIMLHKQIPLCVLYCSSHDVHVRKVANCNHIWHLVVNIKEYQVIKKYTYLQYLFM